MRLLPFSVFVVSENSMLPAYVPGDHVVTFNWGAVGCGDVIVFTGLNPDRCYVKRISKIAGGKIFVAGDNKKQTAKMLSVSFDRVVGKVVWKY